MENENMGVSQELAVEKERLMADVGKIIEAAEQRDAKVRALESALEETRRALDEANARAGQLESGWQQDKSQYMQAAEENARRQEQLYNESQWYLGEEKFRREQLENTVKDAAAKSDALEARLYSLEQQIQAEQKARQEAEWFLGEAKAQRDQALGTLEGPTARCQELEAQLAGINEQLQAKQKEAQDAQWHLGEEIARREQADRILKDSVAYIQDLELQLNQMRIQWHEAQRELQSMQSRLAEARIPGDPQLVN